MEDRRKTKKQLIEELERMRQAAARSEDFTKELRRMRLEQEKFAKAFLHGSIPMCITTLGEGRLVDANPAFLHFTGYSRNEIIGYTTRALGLIGDDTRSALIGKLKERGRVGNLQMRFTTKNGSVKHGLFNAVIIGFNREEFLLSTITDVTDRIRVEEALRESEERYRTVIDFTFDWEYWLAPDGSLPYMSPSCERITGYTAEAFQQDPGLLERIVHSDDRQRFTNHIRSKRRAVEAAEHHQMDFRIVSRSGEERWIGHICRPVYGANGQYRGRRISNRDITDRIRAEKALSDSEELYRSLLRNANDAVFIHAITQEGPGQFIDVNERACQMLGYTREEMLSMAVSAIDIPEQAEKVPGIIRQLYETGQAFFETEHKAKDGRHIPVEVSTRMLHIRDKPTILSIARDITERKRADYLYRALAANAQSAIFIVQDGRLRFVNPYVTFYTGYEEDELLGRDPIFLIHPDDLEATRANALRMIKGDRLTPYEFRLVCKDGNIRWIMETNAPINFEGKSAVLMNSMDITELKRAEAEREKLISALEKALSEVKTLSGMLPICASCKKVRDDTGYWNQIEAYIKEHANVEFSHGICPECMRTLYPDYYEKKFGKKGDD